MATKKKTKKKSAIKKAKPKKTIKKTTLKATAKKATAKKAAGGKTATKRAATPKTSTGKWAGPVTSTTPMAAHIQKVQLGQTVPDFDLPSTGGRHVTLNGLKGRPVVLYFYPKDSTPGCTIEGHEFTKLHDEFKSLGAEVYGVSRDDVASHEKFKGKECYSFDLLSDTSGEVCEMFDVIRLKNMYGKEVKGIERSTFVIDGDGKLIKEWRGVRPEGHAKEVLEFLRTQEF